MNIGSKPLYIGSIKLNLVCGFLLAAIVLLLFFSRFPNRLGKIVFSAMVTIGLGITISWFPHYKSLFFDGVLFSLFVYSGAYVAINYQSKLNFQVNFFLILCLFFSLFQMFGLSSYSQYASDFLNDSPHAWNNLIGQTIKFNIIDLRSTEEFFLKTQEYSRYASINPLIFTENVPWTLQYRPAGTAVTNNILSYFILVGFAFVLRQKSVLSYFFLLPLSLLLVLSMAKIVMIGFISLCLFSLIVDRKKCVLQILFSMSLVVVFFVSYTILLPNFFKLNLSVTTIMTSLSSRLLPIIGSLPRDSVLFTYLAPIFDLEVSTPLPKTQFSAYQSIINYWVFLIPISTGFIGFYLFHLKKISIKRNSLCKISTSLFLVSLIFLGAVPFLKAKVFWWFFGVILAPVLLNLNLVKEESNV
jgi:hypothetical protein